ncbi:MAG: cytochrome c [Gemmatimonadota bacterium]|nr:cytochrome c [Gemmatimonadota bacterium]
MCKRLKIRFLLTAIVATAASGACVPLDDFMGDVFGRSMRDQPSFDPYENVLLPPEGSVPFAAGNYPAGPYDVNVGQPEGSLDLPPPFTANDMINREDIVNAIANPVPPTAESLARGEELYERVCIVCHGPDGAGTTGYIFEVHPAMAAYSLTADVALARSDGYIYGMIRVGRGLMPAYAHQIAHYDRWHVVNYVRQLQGLLVEGADDGEADAEAGGTDGGATDESEGHGEAAADEAAIESGIDEPGSRGAGAN